MDVLQGIVAVLVGDAVFAGPITHFSPLQAAPWSGGAGSVGGVEAVVAAALLLLLLLLVATGVIAVVTSGGDGGSRDGDDGRHGFDLGLLSRVMGALPSPRGADRDVGVASSGAASENSLPDRAADQRFADREHVLRLVMAHDGRLKQSRIVERTEWSKAKVSRLLSQMDAEGAVSKIRLGRENLICLPDREPDIMDEDGHGGGASRVDPLDNTETDSGDARSDDD